MSVFDRLVGQHAVTAELTAAATAARGGMAAAGSSMVHSWLFTGPPGSGRSVAAVSFAAALQCTADDVGCGRCHACTTTMAGTHADVRRVIPEGLSIGVDEMRGIVQIAARRPSSGRWQIVVIEDADRLTEGAGNVLLKVVEEPPARTLFLLCAPSVDPEDISVTLRSRCRHVHLVTPDVDSIARVLVERDGLSPDAAREAAAISGGHVGRARRLATDEDARARRRAALALAAAATNPLRAYEAADELVRSAESEAKEMSASRDEKEKAELEVALGKGGTGKGTAGAVRGSAGALKELERRQKSRATRAGRDALDRALNRPRRCLPRRVGRELRQPSTVDSSRSGGRHRHTRPPGGFGKPVTRHRGCAVLPRSIGHQCETALCRGRPGGPADQTHRHGERAAISPGTLPFTARLIYGPEAP